MMRGTFSSDTITVKHEDGVPMVEVTINGKVTRSMVLDSGASMVSIPADLAKDLGLVPDANSPVLHLHWPTARWSRAGRCRSSRCASAPFTVEDVECAVLPADLISAEPLLGGSFLKNFIYKLDPQASELHMARIGGNEDKQGTRRQARHGCQARRRRQAGRQARRQARRRCSGKQEAGAGDGEREVSPRNRRFGATPDRLAKAVLTPVGRRPGEPSGSPGRRPTFLSDPSSPRTAFVR